MGCGKGYFLRRVCEKGGARGFGFDTSYVGPEVDDRGVRFYREYFSSGALPLLEGRRVHTVVCRHVIEHVESPVALLRGVAPALDSDPPTQLFFETPDLRWIARNGVFWDFYLPKTGWRVWLEAEATEAVFDGAAWTTSADRPERVAALGISATATVWMSPCWVSPKFAA